MTAPAIENKQHSNQTPAPEQMLQIINGFWISRAVYVIAKLGIPDLLKDGPKSAEELASHQNTRAFALSHPARTRERRRPEFH
jgi:Dimerisation domain